MKASITYLLIATIVILLIGGCANTSSQSKPLIANRNATPTNLSGNQLQASIERNEEKTGIYDTNRTIQPGDKLIIQTTNQTLQTTVMTDGRLDRNLLERSSVSGKTVRQFKRELQEQNDELYRNCSVQIEHKAQYFVYLREIGKSKTTYPIEWLEGMSLSQLIRAELKLGFPNGYIVKVVRPSKSLGQKPAVLQRKLDSSGKIVVEDDVLLNPNDSVYIKFFRSTLR